MNLVTVLGARPQFIKAGAVSREIKNKPFITEKIIHTGQHYDSNMSDVFFDQMSIPIPNYRLNISNIGHGAMTGRMLEELEKILIDEKPDAIMVYGDTNTTLAGALAGVKLHIPIIHVESGLRSYNMIMPEEINRILTDRVSSLLLCPTKTAVNNLKKEGYDNIGSKYILTGDVMYDAALFYSESAVMPDSIKDIDNLQNFILVTVHRAENTNDKSKLSNIVSALNEIAKNETIIFPVHPRTKKLLDSYSISENIYLIEPVGYMEIIWLLKHSFLVMTDSGGLQKESYFFNSPCITLRDETEWVELVDSGVNKLAGANKENIISIYNELQSKELNNVENLYGDGNASKVIVEAISSL